MANLKDTVFDSTESLEVPAGTSAQRPSNPEPGMMRYNTDLNTIEFYDGVDWQSAGVAPGTTQDNPASSPQDIVDALGSPGDGPWWYQHSGEIYRAYTRFNWYENSHWVLVLKVHDRGDMPSGSPYWTNNDPWNWNDFNLLSNIWSKYKSYLYYPFNRVIMEMNGVIPSIMGFNTTRTMVQAMNVNGVSNGAGIAWDDTNPSLGIDALEYYDSRFYFQGGPFSAQTNNERYVQKYGINTWGNSSSNGNPDNQGHSSVGRAGARIGCPLDNGRSDSQKSTNSGSDSGFGFGGCAGNDPRTWSCGYGEWSTGAVINTLPGYVWVR